MKKLLALSLSAGIVLFQYCSPSKKAQKEPVKTTFESNVLPVISSNCSPCHVPPNGKSGILATYDAAKSHIDEIITRIQKNPGEKGFMPFKHNKLSDSTIQVFVQWKSDGLIEK
jgi:hypothetical protein